MDQISDKSIRRVPSSFRDNTGFVYEENSTLFRAVTFTGDPDYLQLSNCGLMHYLHQRGLLVPHRECASGSGSDQSPKIARVLEPDRVPFLSWPWEWSFSQWKDAAIAVLDIQRAAVEHGMRLKDASAFNVQFHHGRPVWIDTLSFEDNADGAPWIAYRQFCRHFLAPLALMSNVDPSLGRLMLLHLDGIPLDLTARLLPWRTRVQAGLAAHIHLQARMQRRHAAQASDRPVNRPTLSIAGQLSIIESLRSTVEGLHWSASATEWGQYYAHTNYGDDAMRRKEAEVGRLLDAIAPTRMVWDFGANDARFSRLAAQKECQTIAWDIDPGAADTAWRAVRGNAALPVLPLVLDLTNPSPAAGWNLTERESLLERGPAELVIALALVHHICLTGQVPLEHFSAFLARCAPSAIIEWVPRDDSQAQRLLVRRPDRCLEYNDTNFEAAIRLHWHIVEIVDLGDSSRRLYRLERLR